MCRVNRRRKYALCALIALHSIAILMHLYATYFTYTSQYALLQVYSYIVCELLIYS